jgi:sec-independent protein translocase protein TatB
MFGIGFTELLFIAIIAILFLGPDKLPDAMVQIGKFMRSIKKTMNEAKSAIDEEMRLSDLKEETLSYKKKLDEATEDLKGFKNIDFDPKKEIKQAMDAAKKEPQKETPKQEKITFKKTQENDKIKIPKDDK